ncbi:MAG: NHLP bacteriocin system secretion protein [Parachlamydiaceae bacterium]|nr:NHLP bacteriocin system secretion protein [Parachlamydiaceae bacterium]
MMDNAPEKKDEKKHLQESQQFFSEDLDQTLHVINPALWITYVIIGVLISIILLWSFFGSIPVKVEGKGVFVSKNGFFSIQAKVSGMVQNLQIKAGDFVKKGASVAEVFEPQSRLKLELANSKVNVQEKDLQRLREEIEAEHEKEKKAILADIEAQKFNIERYQDEVISLKRELERRKKLADEGLIAPNVVRDAEKDLNQREIALEKIQAEVATSFSKLNKSYRTEEYKTKEQLLLQTQQDRDLLQMERNFASLNSPFDGTVIEVLSNEGDRVIAGAPIVLFEHVKDPNELDIVYGFIPVEMGKRVKIGLPVQIEVSTVRKEEFGQMLGNVKEISEFAVSKEHFIKLIPNEALINYLMGGSKAVMQLLIEPQLDSNTPSGYRWTSEKGPPIKISSGTVCTISAIVERVKPFYFVFPFYQLREVASYGDFELKNTNMTTYESTSP